MPGYPADPKSQHLERDFAYVYSEALTASFIVAHAPECSGRKVREIIFAKGSLIGGFAAHDYFGDGSFFLLDTPGVRPTASHFLPLFLKGICSTALVTWLPSRA